MTRRIGVDVRGPDSRAILQQIQELEAAGVDAAWLTMGTPGVDPVTLLSAVAVQTQRILLGTAIVPTWPRHPVLAVQQARTLHQLAPGRFRLGVGTSHQRSVETTYGIPFVKPLTHLREYLTVARQLLTSGESAFHGSVFDLNARIGPGTADVPVFAAALRPKSWEVCGEAADGGISWVCPHDYLRQTALPAMRRGAERAGRATPALIAHVPVAVTDDEATARAALREQLAFYPKAPFYQGMFVEAGYPEARDGAWSDAMIDGVLVWGTAGQVQARLADLLRDFDEILVSTVTTGQDVNASRREIIQTVAGVPRA